MMDTKPIIKAANTILENKAFFGPFVVEAARVIVKRAGNGKLDRRKNNGN